MEDADDIVAQCFNYTNVLLPENLSEDLFKAMTRWRILDDSNMHLFSSKHAVLHGVDIRNLPLSIKGLQSLGNHKLETVTFHRLSMNPNDIVDEKILNFTTQRSMTCLKLIEPDYQPQVSDKQCGISELTLEKVALRFTSLTSLAFVGVDLNNTGLSVLCQHISPTVHTLDISQNRITDISCLSKLSQQLKSLTMYNLHSLNETSFDVIANDLVGLHHLDISCDIGHQLEAFLNEERAPLAAEKLLQLSHALTNIRSLDLSGRERVTPSDVRGFINTHPSLRFIGLVMTPVSYSECTSMKECRDQPLEVSSFDYEDLIMKSLVQYKDRAFYVHKALVALHLLINFIESPRHDFIQAVIYAMEEHLSDITVQMAGSACLYYLCKGSVYAWRTFTE